MSISASSVKDLREKTGAGMLDCKKALEESQGDFEKAIEFLRKKGLSAAAKKATRTAAEGTLGFYYNDKQNVAALLEVNCETDFVVKTDDFQNFVKKGTDVLVANKPKDVEALRANLQETLTQLIAKIGENIQVRRFALWQATATEKIGCYLHAGNKIGVLVRFADPEGKLAESAAKEVAMHVAAMSPQYLRRSDIPAAILEKEREINRSQIDTKKPVEIQNKIIEGKIAKYFTEVCLEEQIFIKDPEGKKSVANWLKAISPKVQIEEFVRLQVGEGLKS